MIRHAEAKWNGSLKEGKGHLKVETGALDSDYSFKSRFEGGGQTNPEELLAASHAGCFSMALSAMLGAAGHEPKSIETKAAVHLNQVSGSWAVNKIELETVANVPGLDDAGFQKIAQDAKANCPISKALAAVDIQLKATLVAA
jgi:osmotically inducible protein OsmC